MYLMTNTTNTTNTASSDAAHADVTDEQVDALLSEAEAAGDDAQADLCRRALDGDESARIACAEVIETARVAAQD